MRSDNLLKMPELNYEQWRELLRPNFGVYTPDDPKAVGGRIRSRSIFGLNGSEIGITTRSRERIHHCERTQRDIRLDGVDHCHAVFLVDGRSTLIQNDQAVELAVGDVAFIDSARPVTYVNHGHERWFSVQLPRQNLISALGYEPRGGLRGHSGTRASRLLFQLVVDAVDDEKPMPASAGNYMQAAVYDLLGAVFAPADSVRGSLYSERMFKRVCDVIKDRFADPDLSPYEIAAELGISIRYLQKLFTKRGCTCSGVIQSVRLNQVVRRIKRQERLKSGEPLSEIAFACGYRDFADFTRAFHQRFGHPPDIRAPGDDTNLVRDARRGGTR
jgi:AraC family transcriptional regulator, positive regulator of tynA and feaB